MLKITFLACLLYSSLACIPSGSFNNSTDYFPNKFNPRFARLFTVSYHGYYKILTVFRGSNRTHPFRRYALKQCGAPDVPSADTYDAVIDVPARLALASTVHLAQAEILGRINDIKIWSGSPDYISSPCLRSRLTYSETVTGNQVHNVNATWGSFNPALWTQMSAKGATLYLFDGSDGFGTNTLPTPPAGINYVPLFEYQESFIQARLDHVGLMSLFLNAESQATAHITAVDRRLQCIRNEASRAQAAEGYNLRFQILWASWYEEWSSTIKGWQLASCPNFFCEMADIIGAQIITQQMIGLTGTPSNVSDESYVKAGQIADIIVFTGSNLTRVIDQKRAVFNQIPAFQQGRIFDRSLRGPNDIFEWAIVEPDVFVEDLLAARYGNKVNHRRVWFRKPYEVIGSSRRPVADVCAGTAGAVEADSCYEGALFAKPVAQNDPGFPLAAVVVPSVIGGLLLLALIGILIFVLFFKDPAPPRSGKVGGEIDAEID